MWPLALRNLRRKKARAFFTLLGLALATGTLFSLLAFQSGYERGLKRELRQLGAHILVVPKGCPYDAASLALHGANWPCYLKASYLSQVAQTPGVAVAAPVFMTARPRPGGVREILVGITPEYLDLKPLWRIRGAFPSRSGELLLGANAAASLHASPGSKVRLGGDPGELTVSGILAGTASPEDDFIFLPLAAAQARLRQPGQLTHVLVKLSDPESLDKTVRDLRGCDAGMQMNVVPLAHLFDTIRSVSRSARYVLGALASIGFIVAGIALANTMLMAVLERTREIGVLRAIGASARQIFALFLAESALLGAVGAVSGIVLAFAASGFVEQWVRGRIPYAPGASLIDLSPLPMLAAGSFAMILAIAAGSGAALRAARLDPVRAFQQQSFY